MLHSTVTVFRLSLLFVSFLVGSAGAGISDFTSRAPAVDSPGHREWDWDGQRRLWIGVPAVVHYQRGGPARIVVTGPEEMLRHLRVGSGHIERDDDGFWHFGGEKLEVTVGGVPLDRISLGGSGKLVLGRLDQEALEIDIGGSGSASAEGRVEHLKIHIGGSGRIAFARLASADADVAIAGSGDVAIAPRDDAGVTIAGSGTVRLQTRPAHLHSRVTGSGKILLADKDGGYSDAVPRAHGVTRFDY